MRCDKMRRILAESKVAAWPADVREHLAVCSGCAEFARHWRLVGAGFRQLAGEAPPEASLGFTARLLRRLEESRDSGGAEFLERVGRRVVLATLVLTLTMLLALVLPSAGPLRGPATADVSLGQSEAMENDPLFTPEPDGQHPVAPARAPSGAEGGRK